MVIKNHSVFWQDKHVFITGFERFVGSHLAKRLLSLGAKVFGLDIDVKRKETYVK